MAGVRARATSGSVATTTSRRTILRIKPAANHAAMLEEFGISFEGVSNSAAPIEVRLLRQTTDGTNTSGAAVKQGDDGETLQTAVAHSFTSTEPTAGDVLWQGFCHPQSGVIVPQPFGREIKVPGGGRLAIDVLALADVDCEAYMVFTE